MTDDKFTNDGVTEGNIIVLNYSFVSQRRGSWSQFVL